MTLFERQILQHNKPQRVLRSKQMTAYQSCTPYLILLSLMPAIIQGYLVPYTLGGTTIMIDASELPAMPSPLLKHVMRGLDKRLKAPGVSSMVHTIKPASKPVQLPPPEPNDIGLNNYKFRTGLPYMVEPYGSLGYEGLIGRPGLSNDFYTTDDGLVHFDIINQDMSSNAIDQEVPTRVRPADDANSYNKLNIMTSERPPDLNPLTVKPNISDSSGQEHVNREYSGVSVKHLLERHLNPGSKDGMSGMHVNPEPIYEKKGSPKDSGTLARPNFKHETRESGGPIAAAPKESGQDNTLYSQTFSFPGSEQLLFEKKISTTDSIQKRFAGQPPEIDFEDDLRSSGEDKWHSLSAERSQVVPVETKTANLQLRSPSTIVERINVLNGSKYTTISSTEEEESTSEAISDNENHSGENEDVFTIPKLETMAIEGVDQTAGASKFTEDAYKYGEATDTNAFESSDTGKSTDTESKDALQDTNFTEPAVVLSGGSNQSVGAPEHSVASGATVAYGNAENFSKTARHSESEHHRMAVEALEKMRLENNVQMIVNSLRNDPEKVPAEHISEVLSPGTMSYSHHTNPTQKEHNANTHEPSFLTQLVNKSNLGNLVSSERMNTHETGAGTTDTNQRSQNLDAGATNTHRGTGNLDAGAPNTHRVTGNLDAGAPNTHRVTGNLDAGAPNTHRVTGNLNAGAPNTHRATGNLDAGAPNTHRVTGNLHSTDTHSRTGSLEAGAMDYKPAAGNDVNEIRAPTVGPQSALGGVSHAAADGIVNLERGVPALSGAANGAVGSSSAAKGNHELLISAGGSLHSVTEDIFRKNSCHCGIRVSHKIIGGSGVTVTEFPWMVGLALKTTNFTFCGGTLITDRHVLTAAHCVFRYAEQPSAVYVKTGASDRSSASLNLNVKAIRVHPKYTEFETAFDIAVVALEDPVEFSATLLPVCPPTDSEPADVYKNGVVIGWGKTDPQGPVSTQLQKTTVDLMTTGECRRRSSYDSSTINNKIICASAPGKDSCQGDSGGPLMVSNNNIIEAIGIVSWGIGCAERQYPGVYTKIYSYRTWIKAMTRSGTKCKAHPIVSRTEPEPVFDFRKDHNIFSGSPDDGVELYPALRPAERFKNTYRLQFEEPETYVFRSPILDDKIDEFDYYMSENSEPRRDAWSTIGTRQQSKTRVNTADQSSSTAPRSGQGATDPVMTLELAGNSGTFGAGEVGETSPLYDVHGNFLLPSSPRHTAGERAVLSQPFQSTVPISYDEGEELADVFKLVNDELTSNDERSSQYGADDGISLSIGDRDVSSHVDKKQENSIHETTTTETLTRHNQTADNNFITESFDENTSDDEDPQQNGPIEELMREEAMDEKSQQEFSSGQYLGDTSVVNQPITKQSYEPPNLQSLLGNQQEGDTHAVEDGQTGETSIDTSKNDSIVQSEFVEQKKENVVVVGSSSEVPAPGTTELAAAIKEVQKVATLSDQQVQTNSSVNEQSGLTTTAEEKQNPGQKVELEQYFPTAEEKQNPGQKVELEQYFPTAEETQNPGQKVELEQYFPTAEEKQNPGQKVELEQYFPTAEEKQNPGQKVELEQYFSTAEEKPNPGQKVELEQYFPTAEEKQNPGQKVELEQYFPTAKEKQNPGQKVELEQYFSTAEEKPNPGQKVELEQYFQTADKKQDPGQKAELEQYFTTTEEKQNPAQKAELEQYFTTADKKQDPGQKANQKLHFTSVEKKHGSQPPREGLPNPAKLDLKLPEDETNQQISLTSPTVYGEDQESFYSKPLMNLGSDFSSADGATLHNSKSNPNSLYQNILERIRTAADNRNTNSFLQSGSSSSATLYSTGESIYNAETNPPGVQIVTQTNPPEDGSPTGTDTSLITIADVFGQHNIPTSTSPPLDIEAIEALIHNLGQNQRKLETQDLGENFELYKRDADSKKNNEIMKTTPVELGRLFDTFDNGSTMKTVKDESNKEGSDTNADLVSAILALQDELLRNISKSQGGAMVRHETDGDRESTNKTLILGQHVVEISKPNFLNLSTNFETTTTTTITEEDRMGETRQSPTKLEDQSDIEVAVEKPKNSAVRDVNTLKESEKPSGSTSSSTDRSEATSSVAIEAHSVEIGSKNGYITLKNFTIGRPGYNFSLSFDDIDNKTASVLGQDPPKEDLVSDVVITLNNFTIGSPGHNFTLDFDDIDHNDTAWKNNASDSDVSSSNVENNSTDQLETENIRKSSINHPVAQTSKNEQGLSEMLNDGHKRQKGDKITADNTTHWLKSANNADLLVKYVKNSEGQTKTPAESSTIVTESGVSGTSTTSASATENMGDGSFGESDPTTNEKKDSDATIETQTQTESVRIEEAESITEFVSNTGSAGEIEPTSLPLLTRGNATVGPDAPVEEHIENTTDEENIEVTEVPTVTADDTTGVSATELAMESSTHKTLEELDKLRVIQSRIAKIQDEEAPEEDVSFLGMLQRHIFPASTSRRRINDKMRAYRKPEDDLNEALSKIFSHYDYYDESDTSWG